MPGGLNFGAASTLSDGHQQFTSSDYATDQYGCPDSTGITTLVYDLKGGQYVCGVDGATLDGTSITTSAVQNAFTDVTFYTATREQAAAMDRLLPTLSAVDLSSQATCCGTVTLATSAAADATPNSATPAEISAAAKRFVGKAWDDNGCWVLASNIAAQAGASLPEISGWGIPGGARDNTQYRVVYNGSVSSSTTWASQAQVGDAITIVWKTGGAHITTVTGADPKGNLLVTDNVGPPANDGVATDVLVTEHPLSDEAPLADPSKVVIYRLSSAPAPTPGPLAIRGPQVAGGGEHEVQAGSTVSLSGLFTASDAGGTISQYTVTKESGLGAVNLNGATNLSSDSSRITVSAAEVSKLTYTTSATASRDVINVMATDGANAGGTDVAVAAYTAARAVLSATSATLSVRPGTYTALSTLFHLASGTATEYRFSETDPARHGLDLTYTAGGQRPDITSLAEGSLGQVHIRAADLANFAYHATSGEVTGITAQAFDGVRWSDAVTVTASSANHAPVVSAPAAAAIAAETKVSSIASISDPDGDAIQQVRVDCDHGVNLNGATNLANWGDGKTDVIVSWADYGRVTLSTSPSAQTLNVSAFDSWDWGGNATVTVSSGPGKATVTAPSQAIVLGQGKQTAALSSLFTSQGTATEYQISASIGTVQLNGAINLSPDSSKITVTVADFSKVTLKAPSGTKGPGTLSVAAYNGSAWGDAALATLSITNSVPVVVAQQQSVSLAQGKAVSLSSLFTASDVDGSSTITRYEIDTSSGGASGTVRLNGATNLSGSTQSIVVSASDFTKLTYVAPTGAKGTDTVSVIATDGMDWSQVALVSFITTNTAPKVTASPVPQATVGDSVSVSRYFTAADADGNAVTQYQVSVTDGTLQLANSSGTSMVVKASDFAGLVYKPSAAGAGSISVAASDWMDLGAAATASVAVKAALVSTPSLNISKLSPDDVANLSSDTLSRLSASQVSSFSAKQIQALSGGQLSSLSSTQVAALKVSALTGDQLSGAGTGFIANLSAAEVKSLSTTKAQALSGDQLAALSSAQVAALTGVQLKAIGDGINRIAISAVAAGQLSSLSAAQVSGLSNDQLDALSAAQLKALTTAQVAAMSADQLNSLTSSQIGAFSPAQLKVLSPSQVSSLSSGVIVSIPAAAIAGLSTSTVAALNPSQLQALTLKQEQGLTAMQLASLTGAQLEALNLGGLTANQCKSLTTAQLSGLSGAAVCSLGAASISGLSPKQIQAIQGDALAGLTPAQIAAVSNAALVSLTSDQIRSLQGSQVQALTTRQVAALATGQVSALSGDQLNSLTSTQFRALTAVEVKALTSDQLAAISGDLFGSMTAAQAAAMTAKQVGALSADKLNNMTATAIAAITPAQLQGVSADALGGLNQTAFNALTAADLNGLTQTQLSGISAGEVQEMTKPQVSGLKSLALWAVGQVKALTGLQLGWLGAGVKTLTTDQVAGLTADQVGGLSVLQLSSLSTAQFSALSSDAIAGLTTAQAKGLAAAEIGSMTASQLQSITAPCLSSLSASQVGAMGTKVGLLSNQQVQSLSPTQVKGLSAAQVASLTAEQVQNLSSDQLAALTAPASLTLPDVAVLSAGQVSKLSAGQVAQLSKAQVGVFSVGVLNSLSKPQVQALSVAGLSADQVGGLSASELSLMSKSQLKAFTPVQLAAYGSDQKALLMAAGNAFALSH